MFIILELYAGIGGINEAFKKVNRDDLEITAIDINQNANDMYQLNNPLDVVVNSSIEVIKLEQFEKMSINILTMSPPCQPFTRIGNKQDTQDPRCYSFNYILSLLSKSKVLPKYILLENVKGFEDSEAHKNLINTLREREYSYQDFLLTPFQFGIPNSRLRYYLIAKLGDKFAFPLSQEPLDYIPLEVLNDVKLQFTELFDPKPSEQLIYGSCTKSVKCYKRPRKLSAYLKAQNQPERYIVPREKLLKYLHLLDVVEVESDHSCCFTKSYGRKYEGAGSFLLEIMNPDVKNVIKIDEKMNDVKDKLSYLLARSDLTEGDERRLEYGKDFYVRYFAPTEIADLMGFPSNTQFPPQLTHKQCYSLIGNSVNVHVVALLLYILLKT